MRALLIGLPLRRMWLLALPMVAAMAFVSHTVSAKGKRAAGSGAAAEFFFDGSDIRVEFRGVVSNEALWGKDGMLPVVPLAAGGTAEGQLYDTAPDWLEFEYSVNHDTRYVLVATEPMAARVDPVVALRME